MASILDIPFKGITSEQLESLNFTKKPWGKPDRIMYPEKPSDGDGLRALSRLRDRVLIWNDDKYFWEYIDYHSDKAKIYVGVINYYPDTFNAYVTEFQCRGGCGKSKHPAGYVFLYITDPYLPDTDVWKEVIKVNSIEDINLGIAVLENELNKLFEERRKGWQTYNLYIHSSQPQGTTIISRNGDDTIIHKVNNFESNKLTLKTSYV